MKRFKFKFNKNWLWLIIPSPIIFIIWYLKNNYERISYANRFQVTYYPNSFSPKIVRAKRYDKNKNLNEDYIFIKIFNKYWEYDLKNKMGFFVDEIEFNSGKSVETKIETKQTRIKENYEDAK